MAREIVFTDENGTELRCHLNIDDKAVLVLDQERETMAYIFDDDEDIDDLISHLEKLKAELKAL